MKVNVILEQGSFMPTKAYKDDAGFDLKSPRRFFLLPGESVAINTGVRIEIPSGYCGFLKSKSGLNVNYGINGEGVIDCGYTGTIVAKLTNNGDRAYEIQRGDKIIQIVFLPIPEVDLVIADKFETTKRGSNGFGSSGR